jgi:hypothetical protein
LRARIDDAQARIGRAAALRGLVAGDLPPLQQLQRQLADATSDDDVERVRQLALTEIAAFMPDAVFVLRKRARVLQQAAVADALVRALVARHIARADEALARGAIVDANAALNLGVRAITGGP